jgi:diacylglycerol kinase family enzyme
MSLTLEKLILNRLKKRYRTSSIYAPFTSELPDADTTQERKTKMFIINQLQQQNELFQIHLHIKTESFPYEKEKESLYNNKNNEYFHCTLVLISSILDQNSTTLYFLENNF